MRTDTLRTQARQLSRVFVYTNNMNNGSSYEERNVQVRKGDTSCRKVHVIVPVNTFVIIYLFSICMKFYFISDLFCYLLFIY